MKNIDARQIELRALQSMIGSAANDTLNTVFPKINDELAKLFEDRNVLLTDGGTITFTGTQLQFTENINIVLNSKISGAAPQVISLGSSNVNLTNGQIWYATVNRTAGTASTAVASTLPAVTSANQEIFLIAKRVDAGDGTQRCYFRTGMAMNAGQSVRLGASGSGSGSGTGDDLDDSQFKASFTDIFSENSANALSSVDSTKTNGTFNAAKNLYQLSYDASKTVTGTGVNMTLSAAPTFTVAINDILVVGTQARRITTVTTQTSYVIEAAFTANPTAAAATVSQGVYTKDLNNISLDGNMISAAFSSAMSETMVIYEDSTTVADNIFDINIAPVIAFSASADNSAYTALQARPQYLTDEYPIVNLPSSGTNLYIRFFANKTSGSGTVNVLKYKAYLHRDAEFSDGSVLNQSACFTDGTGTEINCLPPTVVSGKTRIQVSGWTFPVGINSGLMNGPLQVFLNGQKLPRYIDATLTPDGSYKEIDNRTIELDTDYSTYNLLVEIIETVGAVDVSSDNSTGINQLQEINQKGFNPFIETVLMTPTTSAGSPVGGTFYSTIVGRASMMDLSRDLKARMAPDRITVQSSFIIQSESGPNGELVRGIPNDQLNQIRLIGNWINNTSDTGQYAYTDDANGYVEVTFFGNGLNMLALFNGNAANWQYSVDGGAYSANIVPSTGSSVLSARKYNPNQVVPIVSNLSEGIHTIRIKQVSPVSLFLNTSGFEILNNQASVKVQPGSGYVNGKKLTLNAQQTLAYNSSFESGVLGTRGGRVITYLKTDGSLAKSVMPVNASQLNLTNADHTNEEIAVRHNYREFGAGRTDDFSLLDTTARAAAFTLDDGTTSLVGDSVSVPSGSPMIHQAAGNFYTFTFVGTGLDIVSVSTVNSGGSVFIDGTLVPGTGDNGWAANKTVVKIVSGLPYGTHTVKFTRTASYYLYVNEFIVYQPKKPTLPAGAIELANYNVMANYSIGSQGVETLAVGVLRKAVTREMTFVGTWALSLQVPTYPVGIRANTTVQNSYIEYTFFGTGLELRFNTFVSDSSDIRTLVDGVALNTTNFTITHNGAGPVGSGTSITTDTYGNPTFTPATGVLNENFANQNGVGFVIRNLSLGKHTIRFTKNDAGAGTFTPAAVDIITPIHSYRSNESFSLQNTLPVGSQGISDSRRFSPIEDSVQEKASAQAVGITANPTTTATIAVPLPDMSVTIKVAKAGKLKISYSVALQNTIVGQSQVVFIYVDNVQMSYKQLQNASNTIYHNSDILEVPVSAGFHKVELYWNTQAGTMTSFNVQRTLLAEEK